jgi:hypothetical protein
MNENVVKKSWDVVATFPTYEEADFRRNQLLNIYDEVKVKRGVSDGEVFRVKVWNKPVIKEKLQKPKNKFKKKQNVKRVQRNDNKKIRARRKESQDFYRE